MSRSTVLSLPPQLVFPVESIRKRQTLWLISLERWRRRKTGFTKSPPADEKSGDENDEADDADDDADDDQALVS